MTRGSSNICAYMRYMHASGQTKQPLCVLLAALAGRRGSHLSLFVLCYVYVCMHGSHLFVFMFVCMLIYARILELAVASQSLAEASRSLAEPRRSLAEASRSLAEASRSLAKPRGASRSLAEVDQNVAKPRGARRASRRPRGSLAEPRRTCNHLHLRATLRSWFLTPMYRNTEE